MGRRNSRRKSVAAGIGTCLPADQNASDVQLLHEILESLPQGVAMFAADGHLLFRNSRYLETYGFTAEDVRPGMSLIEMSMLRSDNGNRSAEARRRGRAVLEAMYEGNRLSGYNQIGRASCRERGGQYV